MAQYRPVSMHMYPDSSTAPSAHSAHSSSLPHFLVILRESERPARTLLSSSAAPARGHPSTRSLGIGQNGTGHTVDGSSPGLGTVLTWRRRAALRWADGTLRGRFFLFALILFVKLLEWMSVRAAALQSNGSLLLRGNQTNRTIMWRRETTRNVSMSSHTQEHWNQCWSSEAGRRDSTCTLPHRLTPSSPRIHLCRWREESTRLQIQRWNYS